MRYALREGAPRHSFQATRPPREDFRLRSCPFRGKPRPAIPFRRPPPPPTSANGISLMKTTAAFALVALAAIACSSQTPTEETGTASQKILPVCIPPVPPTPFIDSADFVGAATIRFTGESFMHPICYG